MVEQLRFVPNITYKKMFGEYLVYYNKKPLMLVCNSTCFLKVNKATEKFLTNKATPYNGAKEHFVIDIENSELLEKVINSCIKEILS